MASTFAEYDDPFSSLTLEKKTEMVKEFVFSTFENERELDGESWKERECFEKFLSETPAASNLDTRDDKEMFIAKAYLEKWDWQLLLAYDNYQEDALVNKCSIKLSECICDFKKHKIQLFLYETIYCHLPEGKVRNDLTFMEEFLSEVLAKKNFTTKEIDEIVAVACLENCKWKISSAMMKYIKEEQARRCTVTFQNQDERIPKDKCECNSTYEKFV